MRALAAEPCCVAAELCRVVAGCLTHCPCHVVARYYRSICASFPSLRILSLRDCRHVSDAGASHLTSATGLRILDVACPLVNLQPVRQLSELPELQLLAVRCVCTCEAGMVC